jgi:hypothetical protein
VNRPEQVHAHHLGNAPGVVAVALVGLRLEERLGVPGLDADSRAACLRGNKLAITVFDSYDAIVAKCCEAWNVFANGPSAVASITSRGWAEVSS